MGALWLSSLEKQCRVSLCAAHRCLPEPNFFSYRCVQEDIIIVGAGPAGLMAAYELTGKGYTPLIIEARNRIGGRAFTKDGKEMGAEFIHGDLPILQSLLKEAGLNYHEAKGEWIQPKSGDVQEALNAPGWPQLMQKLKGLETDMSLEDFLTKYFADNQYAALKDQAIGFAEGFDTADTRRASAKALYEEWQAMETGEDQYRINGGYGALMQHLARSVQAKGGRLLLDHPVSTIEVSEAGIRITAGSKTFTANKAILAVPLGVLQKDKRFLIIASDAERYITALHRLGFGDVIKFILQFRSPFWEETYPNLGFLLSGAPVPTWWTQLPQKEHTLTGWLGGRAARTHTAMSESQLAEMAIQSLAQLFSKGRQDIADLLTDTQIANWSSEPYTLGSYAYATVGYQDAQQILYKPLNGGLFFAGEYMYSGSAMGTVEAALWSGRTTAEKL